VFVGVRLGLFVLGMLAIAVIPSLDPVSVPGWAAHPLPDPGWHDLFTVWERFDALWFLRIATDGYRASDGSAVFFPLFPLTIRAVSFLIGGHPLAAGFIVSNLSILGALVVLYFLTTSELSEHAARSTVLYVALFPTSFFFFMPYSESLFLLLAVTAFWGARRDRWLVAAVAAALAAATRSVGIVLVPALAVEALLQWRERDVRLAPRLAAAAFAGSGTLAYLAYWGAKTGDWLAPIDQQANWERHASWPWATLLEGTRFAFRYLGDTNGGYWLIDWVIVVPILAVSTFALFKLRPSYSVYLWGGLLIPLSFIFRDRPLMSMPRFILPLFPAFWGLSLAAERLHVPRTAVVAVGAAGLGLLVVLSVNWYYIF
jgi:Gpi18-like mannosyltransferase